MTFTEIAFGGFLIALLLALAGFYAMRQRTTLRFIRSQPEITPEDQHYLRRQVRRRLICSVLMVVFAGLLIGWFFIEANVEKIEPTAEQKAAAAKEIDLNPEQKDSVRFFTLYIILIFVVLFAILFLAAFDVISTAKFGLRYARRIEADRRISIAKDTSPLRKQRNGPPGV